MTMKRHLSSGLLLLVAVLCLPSCSDNRPSVILIAIDTLRTDAVGCYGSSRGTTPSIDQFSKESALFESAYSQAPWTLPSFASLFTSTYPGEHGAQGTFQQKFSCIRKGLKTAAESFQKQDYATAAIVNNIFLKGAFGFKKGFEEYDFFPAEINKIRKAKEVSSLAIRWLNENAGKGRPFFLFLHYFDPHFAYLPPPRFMKQFGGSYSERIRKIGDPVEVRDGTVKLDTWDKECLKNLYHGEVAYTDQEVGRLLGYLGQRKLLNNTVVIITSDHGEEFWDHGDFEHGHSQYEELVKVPLLIRFPQGLHGGRRFEDPVKLMDLMPTLHEYLNLSEPDTFRGSSFLSLLQEGGRSARDPIFFETCLYGSEKKALRANNMKLIMDMETMEVELFDLAADPLEKNDLASARPDVTQKLKDALLKMSEALKKAGSGPGADVDLPAEDLEALRNLGYMDSGK